MKQFILIDKINHCTIYGTPDIRYQIRAHEEVRNYVKNFKDCWVGEFGTCIVTEEVYMLLLLIFSNEKNS